jgi:hypothetical protein
MSAARGRAAAGLLGALLAFAATAAPADGPTQDGSALPDPAACEAPAAASRACGAAVVSDPRAWTERRGLLGGLRWWVDPRHVEALRTLQPGTADLRVEWAVPAGADGDVSGDEREILRAAKEAALRAPPAGTPQIGSPAAATAVPPGSPYRVRARVTETWRPYRLLNVLIVALPGPGAPFVTQGGAAVEIEVLDAEGAAVAGFECRGYAGVTRFFGAFARIAHARGALEDCAGAFVGSLRTGRLPASLRAVADDGTVAGAQPAAVVSGQ